MQWERTFEFSVPVQGAWEAFNDHSRPTEWNNVFVGDPYRGNGSITVEVLESVPEQVLRWSETEGDDRVEMTATFTATETGSRITLTRSGFGEGDEWAMRHTARLLGWEQSMHDFAVFVETGAFIERCLRVKSAPGMTLTEVAGGLRVLAVRPNEFAAKAGVEVGDLIVRMAGAAVFDRSDIWLFQALLEPGTETSVDYVRGGEILTGSAPMSTLAAW
jgi:hypothetical protein